MADQNAGKPSWNEQIMRNLNNYRELYYPFQALFKFKLSEVWINNLLGLDVIKLDEILQVPDGVSTKEYIQEHYGDAGVAMVMRLLRSPQLTKETT